MVTEAEAEAYEGGDGGGGEASQAAVRSGEDTGAEAVPVEAGVGTPRGLQP